MWKEVKASMADCRDVGAEVVEPKFSQIRLA